MARKERFLCGHNAYVGDCSGFKNRRLGAKGIFHSAISRRYKHGAHLSLLSTPPLWAHLGKEVCMLFSGVHFTQNSVCYKVCGWGIILPSPERKTGFEILTVEVRELETHIFPHRKWG